MPSDIGLQASPIGADALTAQADKLTRRDASGKENAKIDKSAKDFESILLSTWLQQAYQTFGSFGGEEDGEDLGSGKDQFQAIAMQALGTAMTSAGGVGIARMIAQKLYRAEASQETSQPPTSQAPAGSGTAEGVPGKTN